jgi:hypothetical protein
LFFISIILNLSTKLATGKLNGETMMNIIISYSYWGCLRRYKSVQEWNNGFLLKNWWIIVIIVSRGHLYIMDHAGFVRWFALIFLSSGHRLVVLFYSFLIFRHTQRSNSWSRVSHEIS